LNFVLHKNHEITTEQQQKNNNKNIHIYIILETNYEY